ncbi:hypothetical protein BGZ76_001786 [Entomortierella beljakovae]|nr:hypothetical protein BGZ76_001786 [Entomortierella beljakovae]
MPSTTSENGFIHMADTLSAPTASAPTPIPNSDLNRPQIIDSSPNSAHSITPTLNTLFDNAPTESFHSNSFNSHKPLYLSSDEKRILIDQQYDVMFNGPHIDFLSKLPYEIATYILHFVDMHNLTKVALISRTWNQFTNDNEVWKGVYLYQKRWVVKLPQPITRMPLAIQDISDKSTPQNLNNNNNNINNVNTNNVIVSQQQQQQLQLQLQKPLNWKKLCYDHKRLEARWTSPPQEKIKLLGHSDSVYCVQFDHSKIVTGSRDQTIKLWDLKTLKYIDTLRGHSQSVLCLQFNDKIMVSGSSDSTIIVWDMETRKPIRRLSQHTAGVLDVCFDDKYIVSCSKDTMIKIWDVETGALVRTMQGHRGPVNAVQLHKGQVVSASGDGMVKLWDIATGRCIRDFIGHDRGLACVQFDGKTIVSGSNDKTIRIWDASTGRCLRVLTGHTDLVRTLHFANNKIVSGSYDHSVKVWDMNTGQCTLDLNTDGHSSWVFDVQFSASRIISTSQDKNIIVWDFSGDIDTSLFG